MLKTMLPVAFVITVSLFIFCFPRFSHSLSFNITNFNSDTDDIAIEGDAAPSPNGDIELNTVTQLYRVGRLTYAQPLHLWDSKGAVTDFSTRFSFTIDPPDPNLFADGFAFYMAPINFRIPPNSPGLYLGLFNRTTIDGVSKNSIVMVEFDTYPNGDFDPSWPHVGINQNSLESLNRAYFEIDSNKGKQGHALITYNATTEYLRVYCSFNTSVTDFSGNSTLSYRIDLKKALPEWVTIGFSAATGSDMENHVIHSWQFSSTLNLTNSTREKKVAAIVSVACLLSLLMLVAFGFCSFRKRSRSKLKDDDSRTSIDFDLKETTPRGFHYQELVAATNGFANNRKLRQGGSGQVYRGVLNDSGCEVAVKKISTDFGSSKRVLIN